MSAADWDLVAKDNGPAQFKPKKDMVIADGQKITLGDVTVTTYITPGHTPGTLSLIIEPLWNKKSVASDNIRHVAAIWGGTDINLGRQGVQYWPDGATMMKTYIASESDVGFRPSWHPAGNPCLPRLIRTPTCRCCRTPRLLNIPRQCGTYQVV